MEECEYLDSYIKIGNTYADCKKTNIIECLKENAECIPDKDAVVFASIGRKREIVTFRQIYDRSYKAACSFIRLGVRPKEIVGINVRTCPEWLYATFGAMMAGAIPVSIPFTYVDGSDLVAMMNKLKVCSLLIMDMGLDGINWRIVSGLLDVGFEDCLATTKTFDRLLRNDIIGISLPDIHLEDTALMLQTSGSTGLPKFVTHTHKSLLYTVAQAEEKFMDSRHKYFNDRPFNWISGFPFSVLTAQTLVTISGFCEAPKDRVSFMMDVINREQCTLTFVLSPVLEQFIQRQDELPPTWPLHTVIISGQPLAKSAANCLPKVGKILVCQYGMSEIYLLTQSVFTDPEQLTKYSCGKPIRTNGLEMKVVDKSGKIVSTGRKGEILARSPAVFKDYFNDPEKTSNAITEDGWFKTDDIGRMNKHGEFFVEGRKSNMIISGGMNVVPELLEQLMKGFPGVDTAVLVPVPDKVFYQVICACVKRKRGSDVTEAELRKVCEDIHIDKHERFIVLPKLYMFVDEIPETCTGKVNRKAIEKLAYDMFQ